MNIYRKESSNLNKLLVLLPGYRYLCVYASCYPYVWPPHQIINLNMFMECIYLLMFLTEFGFNTFFEWKTWTYTGTKKKYVCILLFSHLFAEILCVHLHATFVMNSFQFEMNLFHLVSKLNFIAKILERIMNLFKSTV